MERIAETHHALELYIFKELDNSLILLFLITVFVNWLVGVKIFGNTNCAKIVQVIRFLYQTELRSLGLPYTTDNV